MTWTRRPSATGLRSRRCGTWRRTIEQDRSTRRAMPCNARRPRIEWPPSRRRRAGRSRPAVDGRAGRVAAGRSRRSRLPSCWSDHWRPSAGYRIGPRRTRPSPTRRPPRPRASRRSRTCWSSCGTTRTMSAVVSDLADAYLAGSSADDLVRAAASLQLLIGLDPDRAGCLRADHGGLPARRRRTQRAGGPRVVRALSVADPVEVAFFDGLIARREGDPARALSAFDRFLELAPDDPRSRHDPRPARRGRCHRLVEESVLPGRR